MRRRRNSWLVLAAAVVLGLLGRLLAPDSSGGFGSEGECGEKFAFGRPLVQGEGENAILLCRQGYAALHDPDLRVSLYSAQRLTRTDADGSVPRKDAFAPDPNLATGERAELNDYRGSGFDRGHLAPSADFSDDAAEMDESFFLSNMVPQNGPMNSGIWSGLESATRACAKSIGEIFVYTGPVFEGGVKRTIGRNQVAVPSALYKIVIEPKAGQARAFMMPNRALPRTSSYATYEVPISRIEALTGLTFFPQGSVDKTRSGTFCANTFGS